MFLRKLQKKANVKGQYQLLDNGIESELTILKKAVDTLFYRILYSLNPMTKEAKEKALDDFCQSYNLSQLDSIFLCSEALFHQHPKDDFALIHEAGFKVAFDKEGKACIPTRLQELLNNLKQRNGVKPNSQDYGMTSNYDITCFNTLITLHKNTFLTQELANRLSKIAAELINKVSPNPIYKIATFFSQAYTRADTSKLYPLFQSLDYFLTYTAYESHAQIDSDVQRFCNEVLVEHFPVVLQFLAREVSKSLEDIKTQAQGLGIHDNQPMILEKLSTCANRINRIKHYKPSADEYGFTNQTNFVKFEQLARQYTTLMIKALLIEKINFHLLKPQIKQTDDKITVRLR